MSGPLGVAGSGTVTAADRLASTGVDGRGVLTLADVRAAVSGVTYRQLDYWIRCGTITILVDSEGSGHPRRFSQRDIARLVVLDRVAATGLFPGGVPGVLIRPLWDFLADDRWADSVHVYRDPGSDAWIADWARPLGRDAWLTIDTRMR